MIKSEELQNEVDYLHKERVSLDELRKVYNANISETKPKLQKLEQEITVLEQKRKTALAIIDREVVVSCDRELKIARLQADEYRDILAACEDGLIKLEQKLKDITTREYELKIELPNARARELFPELTDISKKYAQFINKIYPLATVGRLVGLLYLIPDNISVLNEAGYAVLLWSKHNGLNKEIFKDELNAQPTAN